MKCEICEEEVNKLYKCSICGRLVCINDFLVEKRICKVCNMTLCDICNEYLAVGVCKYCGRLICEKCSIEVGVERICLRCAKILKS